MAGNEETLLRQLARTAQLMPVIPTNLLFLPFLLLLPHLWLQMSYSSAQGAPRGGQTAQSQGCITWPRKTCSWLEVNSRSVHPSWGPAAPNKLIHF